MKKVSEKVRKKLRREKILKAALIQILLLTVLLIKIYECRPVNQEDTVTISFFADDVFYDQISPFATPIRKSWFVSSAGKRYRYECYGKYEQLQTQDRTTRLKSEYLNVTYVQDAIWYGSYSIVDLCSSLTVFYTMDDYNQLLEDARIKWIILFFIISFIVHGGLFFLIDKISLSCAWHKIKQTNQGTSGDGSKPLK